MPNETVRLANEIVPIEKACAMLGMDIGVGTSKLYCPFGEVFHQDNGREKSLRVYPETNSAWCFAGCGYFTPVKFIAWDKDLPEEAAAELLLQEVGYVPPDFESQWDAMMAETPTLDTAALAEALKVACSRMARDWESRQFEDNVSSKLAQCLGLLRKVRTPDDADRWLAVAKQAMAMELEGEG